MKGKLEAVRIENLSALDKLIVTNRELVLSGSDFENHHPFEHWIIIEGNLLMARASLWNPDPSTSLSGYIGHFHAESAEAAEAILEVACTRLKAAGARSVIGPINGNTWRSYRFVVEGSDEAAFFMEPSNPASWPDYFRAAGFRERAHYFSAISGELGSEDPELQSAKERLQNSGLSIRSLDLSRVLEELELIYQLSLECFKDNFLYSPIERDEFLSMYGKIVPALRAELVLIAERKGEPIGYVFGVPDLAVRERMIVKTVAVCPGRANMGLGRLLVSECQLAAVRLGFRRAIHALMHESNASLNLSARYARKFRRYALFSRELV
jgi:L-amino acid N-acyltransferase YncA